MRRALVATAGTVVALVALLDYKASGTVHSSHVAVSGGATAGAPPTTTTTVPGTTAPTTTHGTAGAGPSIPTTPSTTAPATPSGQYTGTDVVYRYGDIVVQITMANGQITNISIPQESATDPRSQSINGQAIPILTSEAMAAQSMNFDVVSGATFTSDAFAQSLQSALTKAGK